MPSWKSFLTQQCVTVREESDSLSGPGTGPWGDPVGTHTDRCAPGVLCKLSHITGALAWGAWLLHSFSLSECVTWDPFILTEAGRGLAKLIVPSGRARAYFHLAIPSTYHLPPWSFRAVQINSWDKILSTLNPLSLFFQNIFCCLDFPCLHVPWTWLSHTSLSLCLPSANAASWVFLCHPTLWYLHWELYAPSSNLILMEQQVHLITGSKIANTFY